MRKVNRKGEVSYDPAAVEVEDAPRDYHFSSSYPTLRVTGNSRAYVFADGKLILEDETEANELRAVLDKNPYLGRYDGHAVRTGK